MRPILATIGVVSAALLGLTVWGCFGLTRVAYTALEKWGNAAPDLKPTLDHLNRPCKGPAGPDACGTLAQINKTAIDAGDAIVRTQLIERATTPHITAAMDQFSTAADNLSITAQSLTGTAKAATGTLTAATGTFNEGMDTLSTFNAKAGPLLDAYTQSGNDMDALIKRKAIGDLLDNLAGVTAHGNAIAGDFQQVADKARADYLRPTPWYLQPVHRAGDIMDISAAIARHTP